MDTNERTKYLFNANNERVLLLFTSITGNGNPVKPTSRFYSIRVVSLPVGPAFLWAGLPTGRG